MEEPLDLMTLKKLQWKERVANLAEVISISRDFTLN
jgi:hypothetical protein